MMKLLLVAIVIALHCAGSASKLLSEQIRDQKPWLNWEASSEQNSPFQLGLSPRELELTGSHKPQNQINLPLFIKNLTQTHAKIVIHDLQINKFIEHSDIVDLELYPARNSHGELTWAFSRWRKQHEDSWKWINISDSKKLIFGNSTVFPFFPEYLNPRYANHSTLIFTDFLLLDDLQDKPRFGDCIWTDKQGAIVFAWLSLDFRVPYKNLLSNFICRALPQPPRHNGIPKTFIITVNSEASIQWHDDIVWNPDEDESTLNSLKNIDLQIIWPSDFKEEQIKDVKILSGEEEAEFPITGRKTVFDHKNNADKYNILDDVIQYLEEKYKLLGIKTFRQEFIYRGQKQANLIAVLPGKAENHAEKPILLGDHIDTAFCEDIFDKTNERVSTPGADDNVVATAVLLRAANILRKLSFNHDIQLFHITGEEFPGDDLGARKQISYMLKNKMDIGGIIIMDMIGWRLKDDFVYQINTGIDKKSREIGDLALEISKKITNTFKGEQRTIWNPKSQLQNTDGIIFSDAGQPVVVLNEHINKMENMGRRGQHDTLDVVKNVDFEMATNIGKVAIETVYQLALK